ALGPQVSQDVERRDVRDRGVLRRRSAPRAAGPLDDSDGRTDDRVGGEGGAAMSAPDGGAARFQIRAVVGLSILLGVFVCLLGRLFYIQVIQERRWEKQADAQQWTRVEVVPPVRGQILDRLDRPLARTENFPTVAV